MKRMQRQRMKFSKTNTLTAISLFLIVVAFAYFFGQEQKPLLSGNEKAEDFSFIYMGDPQADPNTGDYEPWGELLARAASDESKPELLLLGGDLVNDGNDPEEWQRFFEAGASTLKSLTVYPAAGNHDDTRLFREQFVLPENGPKGAKEFFYSFDHKGVHFIVMDSNLMGAAELKHMEWLQADLAKNKEKLCVVMFHHPPYPASDIPKDTARAKTIRENFVPLLEAGGVDLVLSGHQHVYMRTKPLLDETITTGGITYLIGTSAGKQYGVGSYEYIEVIKGDVAIYSVLSVSGNSIGIKSFDGNGELIDEATIENR